MATGETGFSDVVYDLIAVQYHALKAGQDYGQYVRDAKNAGYDGSSCRQAAARSPSRLASSGYVSERHLTEACCPWEDRLTLVHRRH